LSDEFVEKNVAVAYPTPESFITLREDFNAAIKTFADNNPDVQIGVLMPCILTTMLLFPFDWLRQTGNESHFLNVINSEAKYFIKNITNTLVSSQESDSIDNAGATEGLI